MNEDFEERKKDAFVDWLTSSVPIEYDLYACDPKDHEFLKEFVPTLTVLSAGGFAPFEANGYMFDYYFYYRESDGLASLSLSDDSEEIFFQPHYTASEEVDENRSRNHWVDSLINLIPKLEKAEFLYTFSSVKTLFDDRNDLSTARLPHEWEKETEEIIYSRGHTPEEALENAKKFEESWYMTSKGVSIEAQKKYHDVRVSTINPTPLTFDTRVFRTPEPTFTVNTPEIWHEPKTNRIITPWA